MFSSPANAIGAGAIPHPSVCRGDHRAAGRACHPARGRGPVQILSRQRRPGTVTLPTFPLSLAAASPVVPAQEALVPESSTSPAGPTRLVPPEVERAVIERLQAGDRSAAGTLYQWYGDSLFRAILSKLPNHEAAEDVLKETFRTALERIDEFQWTGRSIWFWLHRIGVNKAMDQHRRDRVRREAAENADVLPFPTPQPLPAPDRTVHEAEAARDVHISLSRINSRYAEVLEMRLLQDRPREECASFFGITAAAFDVLFHRACKSFRKVYPP